MPYNVLIKLSSRREVEKLLKKLEENNLGKVSKVIDEHSFVFSFNTREDMMKGYNILKKIVFPHK